jgi:hypothetical protein
MPSMRRAGDVNTTKARQSLQKTIARHMQTPSHQDQDQFEELRIADYKLVDRFASGGISEAVAKSSDSRGEMDIDELVHLLSAFTRPVRRTVVTFLLNHSTLSGNPVLPNTAMPPPSRFTRRSRTAGPRPLAN